MLALGGGGINFGPASPLSLRTPPDYPGRRWGWEGGGRGAAKEMVEVMGRMRMRTNLGEQLTAQKQQVPQPCPGCLAAKSGNRRPACTKPVPENLMKSPGTPSRCLPTDLHNPGILLFRQVTLANESIPWLCAMNIQFFDQFHSCT